MHAFLPAVDCAPFLAAELERSGAKAQADEATGFVFADTLPALPYLAFARQSLPESTEVKDASINGWADQIITRIAGVLPDAQPWRLHLWTAYGEGRAGLHRCSLIRAALNERLKKRRRALLRSLEDGTAPFTQETSLVQAVLTGPDAGYISVSSAPQTLALRAILSPFIGGNIPHAEDKAAPSRAFAKVIEAELRLGQQIERGQTCVDLGASPGSWSYVAIQRGARVTAIDRSPLRDDLMRNPRLDFIQADAFKFRPEQPVDWLICDIIAAPQRSIDLLLEWLRERQMRRFIVTLKFKGTDEYALMDQLKELAPPLCQDFRLNRLCANKNEVTAFGIAAGI
ncbi:23S rRNA (cytidine2498-2'-O)-methyltransferase [Prosthecobacter fusiformis]|uniref:23S rRNA (Cytidine2498-2'-O)-methyltransferase n=1 Tax=Prosthecobacter fusiformis TaxID=48464 RepID=A0A4R7RYH3_9BACT|nr:SAM-dependent methyltransferase [Prosthecobacter fusiformis]TDU70922.1 23S rRNA (cytidine2498-2'-O)-methyltransferase [Prosthecobacter fusiformis]